MCTAFTPTLGVHRQYYLKYRVSIIAATLDPHISYIYWGTLRTPGKEISAGPVPNPNAWGDSKESSHLVTDVTSMALIIEPEKNVLHLP